MQFEIDVQTTTKKMVEVEFPMFFMSGDSPDHGGWYETYYRLEQDGNLSQISINDREEWEFEKKKSDLKSQVSAMLNSYYETIESTVFYQKLDDLRRAVEKL